MIESIKSLFININKETILNWGFMSFLGLILYFEYESFYYIIICQLWNASNTKFGKKS